MITVASIAEDRALIETERSKYKRAFAKLEYRVKNHGLELWQMWRAIFPARPRTALDIGCGNGRLFRFLNMEGIDAYGVDIVNALDEGNPFSDKLSVQCLWQMHFALRFDIGICADVMEHIPPNKVDDVIACIARCCNLVVFKIANYPSAFVGENLHLSLHDDAWWLAKLQQFGEAEFLPGLERPGKAEYVFRFKPHV